MINENKNYDWDICAAIKINVLENKLILIEKV